MSKVKNFFHNIKVDMAEIKWTKPKDVAKSTVFVMTMTIVTGAIFMGYDLIIQKIISMIL